jgi:hypothetical protein
VRAQRDVREKVEFHKCVWALGVRLEEEGGQLDDRFQVYYARWLQAKFTCEPAASCQRGIYDGVEYAIYLTLPEARTSNMRAP